MLKVLIADDHAVVRQGLAYLINSQPDFKVVSEAGNGTDAYARVEQGNIDILVMDLSMPPGESGLVTTQRVHERFPNVKILILSMHEEQEYINQAIHNGAMSYILKSSPDSELVNGLNALAANRRYIDQNITLTKSDIKQIEADGLDAHLQGYRSLSKREREVFPLMALGYTNKEIANRLFISTKTVEAHKASIMHKLSLNSRPELVRYAVHHHLIEF